MTTADRLSARPVHTNPEHEDPHKDPKRTETSTVRGIPGRQRARRRHARCLPRPAARYQQRTVLKIQGASHTRSRTPSMIDASLKLCGATVTVDGWSVKLHSLKRNRSKNWTIEQATGHASYCCTIMYHAHIDRTVVHIFLFSITTGVCSLNARFPGGPPGWSEVARDASAGSEMVERRSQRERRGTGVRARGRRGLPESVR